MKSSSRSTLLLLIGLSTLSLSVTGCSQSGEENGAGDETTSSASVDSVTTGGENQGDDPADSADVKTLPEVETPEGYTRLGDALGNLDDTPAPEKVIVFDTPRRGDFGTERELHIYRAEGGAWKLWHRSIGPVLPSEHGGMMGDPFQEISIERKAIVISHAGGSREKWNLTHRYRFQNNRWELIGATTHDGAPCDYWTTFDYNLSTGNAVYKRETEMCDEQDDSKVTTTVTDDKQWTRKLKKLPEMDGFYPGDNEVEVPGGKGSEYF